MGGRPNYLQARAKTSLFERRILPVLRQLRKFTILALAFTYPISLVYVGPAFGGLAFLTFLGAPAAVTGMVITRLGYASNLRHWNISFRRKIGVLLGFLVTAGFYVGLIYLKIWLVPIAFGLVGLGEFLVLRRSKSNTNATLPKARDCLCVC